MLNPTESELKGLLYAAKFTLGSLILNGYDTGGRCYHEISLLKHAIKRIEGQAAVDEVVNQAMARRTAMEASAKTFKALGGLLGADRFESAFPEIMRQLGADPAPKDVITTK